MKRAFAFGLGIGAGILGTAFLVGELFDRLYLKERFK